MFCQVTRLQLELLFSKRGFCRKDYLSKSGVFKLKSVGRYFNDINNHLYLNKGAKGEACWNFNYISETLDSIHVEEKDLLSEKNKLKEVGIKL